MNKNHLAIEVDNATWKNAVCILPPTSQHRYEIFHVHCVNFSFETALITDTERGESHTAFYNWLAQNITMKSLYSHNIFHMYTLHGSYRGSISFQI